MAHDEPEDTTDDGVSDVDGGVSPSDGDGDTFPVVGIGASAGGLHAFQEFLAALPARPDMAFVLVQHLSPDHESALAELVQSRTEMRVTQVADHPDVEPNRVYVIPPGRHLEIEDGQLRLTDARRDRGRPAAVDDFFRSLADDMGERAVCIVLSGTGSDGSLGLKAVKERTGLTMAQTPSDAEYDGMPKSAIGTDLVDVVGTARELAERLVEIRRAPPKVDVPSEDAELLPETDHQALQAIFAHLRQRTAHDFTNYKRSTILRRLARRLQVTGQANLPEYAGYLRSSPDEVQALLRDFLISVTQFFRDADAFDVLEADAIPALFEGKGPQDQVRVWVAGCATGEEAYSIAMLLCEYQDRLVDPPDIQIFATDIDEEALARAREGLYAEVAAADVPISRLRRFFSVEAGGVRVKQELRQMVLFAQHNLISDPPFSRLDLVACRNVLIYFNRKVQSRVFATFHYALRQEGLLFLGSAEGPGATSKGFGAADKKARLYRRRPSGGPERAPAFASGDGRRGTPPTRPRPADPPREGLVERYRDWTLESYAPPRVLVDEHYDVTHVFGDAGRYLRDREGPVTQNVVDKVVRAFRMDLRASLFRAFSKGKAMDTGFQRVEIGGEESVVRLHVGLAGGKAAEDGLAEVVFIELDPASVAALDASVVDRGDIDGDSDDPTVSRLEDELRRTRARLQLTIEESETSKEELKASNEELQSINEELQSTTEELETSKEELQSTNEELKTVNQELSSKVEELVRSNSDLNNLIASTDVGTVFLDRSLRLKRYTPRAADVFHMVPS
ncbi:MAG: chemotaxis protein CheB, partial [Rubrivirga sp.]